jgi:hypothetical protein
LALLAFLILYASLLRPQSFSLHTLPFFSAIKSAARTPTPQGQPIYTDTLKVAGIDLITSSWVQVEVKNFFGKEKGSTTRMALPHKNKGNMMVKFTFDFLHNSCDIIEVVLMNQKHYLIVPSCKLQQVKTVAKIH